MDDDEHDAGTEKSHDWTGQIGKMMKTLKSEGIVRRIVEEDGEFLVSFPNHDGYFKVPPSEHMDMLKEKILAAQKSNQEISFTFDAKFNILKIA